MQYNDKWNFQIAISLLRFNFLGFSFVNGPGGSGILEEFQKNTKAIWLLRSEFL